jgi:hypothetical protein
VGTSGDFSVIASGLAATTTSYTDTSVSNGNTYTYEIRPYAMEDGVKTYGAFGDPQAITMAGMINATPTSVTVYRATEFLGARQISNRGNLHGPWTAGS